MPVYAHLNGGHPLLAQLIEHVKGFDFQAAAWGEPSLGRVAGALSDAARLGERLLTTQPDAAACDPAAVERFLASRDPGSLALAPEDADLTFLHTTPLTFDASPWLLHLESVSTLFWPFLHQGALRGRRLYEEPVYPVVARLLASDNCRGLFTHCRHTVEQIERIFQSDAIAAKVRYAPLGVRIPPDWRAAADAAMAEKHRADRPMEILFTNSWHQAPENFCNRGGLDIVAAFIELHRQRPNVHLTVRSSVPTDIDGGEIGRILREHPAITLLDEKISDDALHRLILAADVFLLPSAALHSVSTLRAMALGAVCVVSDLPVFAEFIDDGVTGAVVRGRAAKTLSVDPESGWEQDDYASMRAVDPEVAGNLLTVLLDLCDRPAWRRDVAAAARDACDRRFSFDAFAGAFADALRAAASVRPSPAIEPPLIRRLAVAMEPEFAVRRHPLAEEPIMTESYRGFNIVWLRGVVYAIRQGTGDVKASDGAEALRAALGPENVVVAQSLAEALARVDAIETARAVQALEIRVNELSSQAQAADEELAQRIDVMCYGPAGDPAAIHPLGDYRGFNLFCHDGRVFAQRQGAESFEPGLPPEELARRFDAGDLAAAASSDDARNAVDLILLRRESEAAAERLAAAEARLNRLAYGPAGDPAVVVPVGEHRGFNLMWRGGRVLAMRQSLGAVDPTLGAEELRRRFAPEDFFDAADPETARCRIDLIEQERRRLVNRLRRRAGAGK